MRHSHPPQADRTDDPLRCHQAVLADPRGLLMPLDFAGLPFRPQRVFVVTDVPNGQDRGCHLTRGCRQLLVCLRPRIDLWIGVEEVVTHVSLDQLGDSFLLSEGEFIRYRHSDRDSMLIVLAEQPYDPTAQDSSALA